MPLRAEEVLEFVTEGYDSYIKVRKASIAG